MTTEIIKLEANSTEAVQAVTQSFDALQALIDKRREEILANIESICTQKKRAFREQQQLIEAEKVRVERDCEGKKTTPKMREGPEY